MTLSDLNALVPDTATAEFLRCCGSTRWARLMTEHRPFFSMPQLVDIADQICRSLGREDWLEAFAAHPRIGDTPRPVLETHQVSGSSGSRVAVGERAVASDGMVHTSPQEARWSSTEQSGMTAASPSVREQLAQGNREYEARFGYILIVCASGRSADEMLATLESRLMNEPELELEIAAEEQRKITRLRLEKLLT